jgi:hypothetical protein
VCAGSQGYVFPSIIGKSVSIRTDVAFGDMQPDHVRSLVSDVRWRQAVVVGHTADDQVETMTHLCAGRDGGIKV